MCQVLWGYIEAEGEKEKGDGKGRGHTAFQEAYLLPDLFPGFICGKHQVAAFCPWQNHWILVMDLRPF